MTADEFTKLVFTTVAPQPNIMPGKNVLKYYKGRNGRKGLLAVSMASWCVPWCNKCLTLNHLLKWGPPRNIIPRSFARNRAIPTPEDGNISGIP